MLLSKEAFLNLGNVKIRWTSTTRIPQSAILAGEFWAWKPTHLKVTVWGTVKRGHWFGKSGFHYMGEEDARSGTNTVSAGVP